MPKRVHLSRHPGFRLPPDTVSVARGKNRRWGNPFAIGKSGPLGRTPMDAMGAVGFFEAMLADPELRAAARYPSLDDIRRELRGKNLACWCKSGPCHADVLLKVANGKEGA